MKKRPQKQGVFSKFFYKAAPKEKKKVYLEVARKASEDLRRVLYNSEKL